jgi:hypothetical protein
MDTLSLESARRFYDALGRGEVPPMMRLAAALIDSAEVHHVPSTDTPYAAPRHPSTAQLAGKDQSLLRR